MPFLKTKVGSLFNPGFLRSAGLLLVILTGSVIINLSLNAQKPLSREYQLKAVFLSNFTQFVLWPDSAFQQSDSPLIIGILGVDPFGSYLDENIRGEAVGTHPLEVRRYATTEKINECHILFIKIKNKNTISRALDKLKCQSILTVSETENFTRIGGMIEFYNDTAKIRLRINVQPATDANLVISSKLLRLAEIDSTKSN